MTPHRDVLSVTLQVLLHIVPDGVLVLTVYGDTQIGPAKYLFQHLGVIHQHVPGR